jgi:transposase
MAKFKRYDYSQKVLIPVSLEEQLVPGSLEFAIHTLIETRMDMSVFEDKYKNDETGRSAYDPKVLLKVVLLGYSRGLISSRQIERACCENVTFMALSGNQRPDHSTIATFVSSMKDQIDADKDDDDDFGGPANREQQIDKLKKQADRIEKWLKNNNAKISSNGRELKSNLTDNDSALMLTSGGTIQGYNGQALVDDKHQIIVHGQAFGSGQDARHLEPMVDGAKTNMEKIGQGANYFKGKILNLDIKKHIRDHNIYRRYMADEADCSRCSLTHRCFYRKNTKRRSLDVPIGAASTNYSKAMQNKVDSDKGRKIYPQRFAIVEPVFANIKTQKRLNRFTLRGKVKVNIQWMLYCMVHNIEKIMNFAMT